MYKSVNEKLINWNQQHVWQRPRV